MLLARARAFSASYNTNSTTSSSRSSPPHHQAGAAAAAAAPRARAPPPRAAANAAAANAPPPPATRRRSSSSGSMTATIRAAAVGGGGGGDVGPEGLAAEADAERARLLPASTTTAAAAAAATGGTLPPRRRPPPAPLFSLRVPRALAAVLSGSGGANDSNNNSPDHVTYDVYPELVAIAAVYFVQGSLGLSRLAVSFFLKDDLELGPAQVALLTSLAAAPWVVKPLYGFVSDAVPLFGYRRRSYLVLCGLLGAASWLGLAGLVTSPVGAGLALLLGALSTAASDVVVDSVVVERARGEPQSAAGGLQSLCWASSAVGGIASAYFSGSLVEAWGVRPVFAATALFPLIVSLSSLLIDEERVVGGGGGVGVGGGEAVATTTTPAVTTADALLAQARALVAAISRRDILLPTAFVFLWQATPTPDTAMFYYYTNALHFDAEFLGRVRLAGSVASLLGVLVYNRALKRVPLRKTLAWAMGLGVALGSTQLLLVTGANRALGIPDRLFVLGDSVVLTALAQLSFMPILVLAARLCPEGVEASLFATLMSVLNGGAFVGSALGGAMTAALGVTAEEFGGLPALVLACNLLTLLPAPFLRLLPPDVDVGEEDDQGGGGGGGGGKVGVEMAAGSGWGAGGGGGDVEDGGSGGGSGGSGGGGRGGGGGNGSGSGLLGWAGAAGVAARRTHHHHHHSSKPRGGAGDSGDGSCGGSF